MVAPTHAIAGPEAHDHEVTAMAPGPTIDGPQRSEYSAVGKWCQFAPFESRLPIFIRRAGRS